MEKVHKKKYASVILPLAVATLYTYEIPEDLEELVEVGKRVQIQFGAKRMYAAIVYEILDEFESDVKIKPIISCLDDSPILNSINLKLWDWMSEYFLCTLGEIMIAALPSAMKLTSETKLLLNPNFDFDYTQLQDNEYLVTEALELQGELKLNEVQKILEKKNVYYLVKSLLDKGVIILEEELIETYKPKMIPYISLAPNYESEEEQKALFDQLEKAPKQMQLLLAYYQLTMNKTSVSQKALINKADATSGQVQALVKKGIFQKEQKAVDRIIDNYKIETIDYELSPDQEVALAKLNESHEQQKVVLLHGVTSSGKTQIYINKIKEQIKQNKNVLYLLPEIALTGQMIQRLRKVFGSEVGIYHSKFNPQERVEIWNKVAKGKYKIIVGVRSSIFLPFLNLGLIIVDEEHDSSYKQQDPAPRYNARDCAIKLAQIMDAKVILGSATPSFESYQNALDNKYGLVKLTKRYGGVEPPLIKIVNMQEEKAKKRMRTHFTQTLLTAIEKTIAAKEQIILFKNRRGYAPVIQCKSCTKIPQCIRCDVSLTYHKYSKSLKCHYCGYNVPELSKCPDCQSSNLTMKGFGTEKIEDELKVIYPEAKIERMDLETTRSKTGFMNIINRFEEKEIDILVGTQMVTKGLDFDNVGLVGILSADSLLNYPDFRAAERAFQLMLQVSGRAGRRQKRGDVIIQTNDNNRDIFKQIINEDFYSFYNTEITERRNWQYPPFNRVIEITLKHRDPKMVNKLAFNFAQHLEKLMPKRVLGPSTPSVSWVRNMYIRTILIKLPKSAKQIYAAKYYIMELIQKFKKTDTFKAMVVQIDVDPY